MTTIKTAVSLDQELFARLSELAHDLNVSRSRLFSMALSEYLQRHHNQRLLDALNEAYDDAAGAAEQELLRQVRRRHRRLVHDE